MNKKKEINDITSAFAMPRSLWEKIQKQAEENDRTPSYIIRRIVRDHYEGK